MFFIVLIFFGCQESKRVQSQGRLTVTDDLGRVLHLVAHPKKVMALAPSMTEYLALICKKEQVIGRTQNCDFPIWVNDLPEVVNYPHLDFELLLKIKPDLIITHKGITPEIDLLKLEEFGIPTYVFLIDSLDKIITSAERIGTITGNYPRGKFVKDSLEQIKLEILSTQASSRTAIGLMSTEPMFAFGKGSLVDELMFKTGVINAIDSSFVGAYPQLDEEYLLRKNPDVLFVTSSISWEDFFMKHPNLKAMDAYKNNKLYQIQANYLSRQGPRSMFGLQELKNISKGY